jgi:hypothetical protein
LAITSATAPRVKLLVMPKDCATLTELGKAIIDQVSREIIFFTSPYLKTTVKLAI